MWVQLSTVGSITDDVEIHNCSAAIWKHLVKKSALPASWNALFFGELKLLNDLAADQDKTLADAGMHGADAKQRMLEIVGGSKPD